MNFLKKLTTPKGEIPGAQTNGGGHVTSMSSNLQRKFAKGCNYNMKLVIRGDRNTGKSALLARLQGKPFVEEYSATEEIQVASINWSYKNTEDVVKVEVWDVVDVAKKRVKISGLKTSDSGPEVEPGLDAEFLDVYQGTHGVVMMMDITKAWTMDYVRREAEKVPSHIPILLLANFTDQGHHRQVSQMQIADFVENFSRSGQEAAEIRWAESSLRNGFGLKFLHRFFNVPFLTLQRQSLLRQLEVNSRDIRATQEELDVYMESDEANYQLFSDSKTAQRRTAAEQVAPPPSSSIVAGQPSNTLTLPPAANIQDISFSNKTRQDVQDKKGQDVQDKTRQDILIKTRQDAPDKATDVAKGLAAPSNGTSSKPSPLRSGPGDMDSFVPESGDFDTFLAEEAGARSQERSIQEGQESSDEDGGMNPMVARFEDSVEISSYNSIVTAPGVPDGGESSEEEQEAKAQDSSDEEDVRRPTITKPRNDLDDFLNPDGQSAEDKLAEYCPL